MPANILPSGIGDLFQLAERMDEGLRIHGPWLFKRTMTPEEFSADREAARQAETEFSSARSGQADASRQFTALDEELTAWLAKARLVVMLAYGNKWTANWIAAGFSHRGTNIPKRIGARMELMTRLADFFAAHREYEVPFAQVTAVEARRLQKACSNADHAVRLAKQEARMRKQARDAAEKKLRREMHSVVALLPHFIGKSDPRWLAFGLKQPRPNDKAVRPCYTAVADAEPLRIDFAPIADPAATGQSAVA
jgi:hypothetical protein